MGNVKRLDPLQPAFFSVTYGAGGSTRERTHATVMRLEEETSVDAAAHLTCVAPTCKARSTTSCAAIGTPVSATSSPCAVTSAGMGANTGRIRGYEYTPDLIAGLKKIAPFEVSVAGYPEITPIRPTNRPTSNLWRKVDAGAERALSQFGFEADDFLRFRDKPWRRASTPDRARHHPDVRFQGDHPMAGLCGSKVPAWISEIFEGLDDDVETRRMMAAAIVGDLCRDCAPADSTSSTSIRSTAPT